MSEDSAPVIGMQLPWSSLKKVPLRIKHVTNLAHITAAGEVCAADLAAPYALLTVETGHKPKISIRGGPNGQAFATVEHSVLPSEALLPVTHRIDFWNLWSIYQVRGVLDDEEVLVTYTPLGGLLGLFIARIQPSLAFAIFPAGQLENLIDPMRADAASSRPLDTAHGLQTTIVAR